ncbi:MAG: hypothetical protein VX353_06330 [Actinomycetota bacterium]
MKFPENDNSEEPESQKFLLNQGQIASPHRCEESPQLILQALDGIPSPHAIQSVREHFGTCIQCNTALDIEIRFKLAMAQQVTVKAPPSLQLKISESLQRIDLGDISITDL